MKYYYDDCSPINDCPINVFVNTHFANISHLTFPDIINYFTDLIIFFPTTLDVTFLVLGIHKACKGLYIKPSLDQLQLLTEILMDKVE